MFFSVLLTCARGAASGRLPQAVFKRNEKYGKTRSDPAENVAEQKNLLIASLVPYHLELPEQLSGGGGGFKFTFMFAAAATDPKLEHGR